MSNIDNLRIEMKEENMQAYVVPTCDFHGSEYIGEYFKTREFLSGFSGSAGTLLVTEKEAFLWTDGRYFLQAESQLKDTEIKLMRKGEEGVPTLTQFLTDNLKENDNLGFYGKTMSCSMAEELEKVEKVNIKSSVDLVNRIWKDRPDISSEPIWILEEKYSGESVQSKISKIRKSINRNNAQVCLLSGLDEIAWVLNLRGNDIAYTPVFLSNMIINEDEAILFVNNKSLNEQVVEYLRINNIVVYEYEEFEQYILRINNKSIWLDKSTTNYSTFKKLKELNNKIIDKLTPATKLKCVKNETEVNNITKAHIIDGVAMTKFIYWLKKNVGKIPMSEISIADKLEELRRESDSFIELSFDTIAGYKEHGAIVHYSASEDTNYKIVPESVVLIDSGALYLEGTTDVTRTISLGPVSSKMKEMYTLALRGHLNLAAAVFKQGSSGVTLDHLAREPLWEKGLDYNHGTGHGVGYLFSVHEGPNAFRYMASPNCEYNIELEEGMVTSDEPGIYLQGEFGIRIENLIVCKEDKNTEYGKFLKFEHLTLVPYDRDLIDLKQMTEKEINLLKKYNRKVRDVIGPYLNEEERTWLNEEVL